MPLIIATPSTIAIAVSAAPQLPPRQALERDAGSSSSGPSSREDLVRVAARQLLDDQPVGEEEDRGRRSRPRAASCVTITIVCPYSSTELAQQLEDLAARLRVEVSGRLVGEEDRRPA